MSKEYDAAKAAVLERAADPHMETCEHCAAYVEEVVQAEMLGGPSVVSQPTKKQP